MKQIRQPIVTVAGHVDHGKTSILDCFRGSCVQEGEAGGITQKISMTSFPCDKITKTCKLKASDLEIPGFLFIDTPGHAAFTNLRKRGGSLADLAILVIDINDGIKPQTAEVIQILKHNKTPFVIALNKVDNISGWRNPKDEDLKENIEGQADHIKEQFVEKYSVIIGALNSYGFDADIFYEIDDFTKKIAMVPCSARTNQGISELLTILCGLSQKFLKKRLELGDVAKGVILESRKDKATNYFEAILYDGELKKNDEIVIASFDEPILTKIRTLEEIRPLSQKFKSVDKVSAAAGVKLQVVNKEGILSGMPFVKFENNLEEIKKSFSKELGENIKLDKDGVIVKADSLGSLEALLVMLRQANIKVLKAGVGKINKIDAISAKANLKINPVDAVVVGFNVDMDDEAKDISSKIKFITREVVFKLIEDLQEFQKLKRQEIEKKRLLELASICKVEILKDYVFRNTKPAIFGIKVLGGTLRKGTFLINEEGLKIDKVKNIQEEKHSVEEAGVGKELAMSLQTVNFERQLKDKKYLYSDISENQFRKFKDNKDLLSQDEIKILQEIAVIKRREKDGWGL